MSRLIDADKLLKGIEELKQSPWYENYSGRFFRKEAVEIIEDLCIKKAPTVDVVEVVRCKDCKHMKYAIDKAKNGMCGVHSALIIMNGNDYCSYGERKEE